MKELRAFPIDLCNKSVILNRNSCIRKCDASFWHFKFKLDKFVFSFKLFKQFVNCSLVPVHMKNISSMNRKYINESPWRKKYIYFFSKWFMKMKIFVWDGSNIALIAQSFIWEKRLQLSTKLFKSWNKGCCYYFCCHIVPDVFLKNYFTTFIPSAFGILLYKDLTSREPNRPDLGQFLLCLAYLKRR